MILVDTNIWSELLRPQPDPHVVRWEASNAHLLWFSAIVLAELRARAALLPMGRRQQEISNGIEQVIASYSDRILPFDDDCSREFGPVLLSARNAGKPIASADAMIAATARAHGMKLATRDGNDFAGTGVDLIDPWNG
jgi:predicted nucleic acid-binding protein